MPETVVSSARGVVLGLALALAGGPFLVAQQDKQPVPDASSNRGALPWFAGSYEELGVKSRREQRRVFIYLWSENSRWCRRLESEALSDPKLAESLSNVLVWHADAERGAGKTLAERLRVNQTPVLLCFDEAGQGIDRIDGYQFQEQYLASVAGVLRNEGTLPDLQRQVALRPEDLELRARFACKLEALGDLANRDAQIEELRKRDRTRTSLPMRREVYAERMARIQEHYDRTREINPGPLVRFIEEERHPDLLFEACTALAAMHQQRCEELEKAQQLQAATAKRGDLRATLIKAAATVPQNPALQVEFAIQTVSTFAAFPKQLSAADKAFLIPLSAGAVALAPDDARAQICVAMASFLNDDKPNAAIALRRARELEPDNPDWIALGASLGL